MKKTLLIIIITCTTFSQNYDPETGELIQDSTNVKIQFDPETGIQLLVPAKKQSILKAEDEFNNNSNLILTNAEIINRARTDAYNTFNGFAWAGLGGPSTLWGAFVMGGIGSEFMGGIGGLGSFLGGLYILPEILSKINVNISYYYTNSFSKNTNNKQVMIYRNAYKDEIINLRKTAIYRGQLGTVGACVGFILLMVVASG